MNLLVLGGTRFLGRHLVEAALDRGHAVTLFNRGQTNAHLFPEVEKRVGDRDGDLSALAGRRWDAVVDTCGYVPRIVRESAEMLADSVDHYTFISSISVYADPSSMELDERAAVGRLEDETVETVDGETYGPLKALCEEAAEAAMPGRVLNVRPGLIVGPHDPTDRFTYWPLRVARGDRFIAPDSPEVLTQVIDARDLTAFVLDGIEAGLTGVFNATGPEQPVSLGRIMEACRAVSGSDAEPVWIDEATLLAKDVRPFMDMPCWVPAEGAGMMQVKVRKAVDAGLSFRPLEDTARDTLAWARTRPDDYEMRAGLSAEREAALLRAFDEAPRAL